MNITKVESNKDKKNFIQIPLKIYRNDKNWIRPLDKDINSVFSKDKNKAYRNGEATRWLLKDNGEVIGRIAAFYSNKNADIYESNLMRRLAGLLYIDSKTMGDIKNKIKNKSK